MSPQGPRYQLPVMSDTVKGIFALAIGILLVLYVFGLAPVVVGYLVGFLGIALIIYGVMVLQLDKKIKQLIRRT